MNTVKAVDNISLESDDIFRDAMRYRALRFKGIRFGELIDIRLVPEELDKAADGWLDTYDPELKKKYIEILAEVKL